MRDDRHFWDASEPKMAFDGQGWTIQRTDLKRLTLVSGARVLESVTERHVGWPDIVTEASYALVLRRDRVLIVNGPETQDGWDEDRQLAVSLATDGYASFDLTGEAAFEVLERGTEIALAMPSRSVMRQMLGLDVLVYRYGTGSRYRLHVARAHGAALWKHVTSLGEST